MLSALMASKWPWSWQASRPQRRQRLLTSLFVLATAIASLRFVLLPVLQRFHMQLGLSLYDYGFYGFYPTRDYISFDLDSPDVELARWDDRCNDGYVFIAPHGAPVEGARPLILDARGNLVWTIPTGDTVQDFHVQEYRGEPYLTYWHGANMHGHGLGSYSMLDSSYVHRYEVTAVGHFEGDIHDFHLTSNNTALLVIYDLKAADLSEVGGPKTGYIYDGVFQEVDIASGNLLFEWHFSHHVPFNESYTPPKGGGKDYSSPWDPYHINSVDKDAEGNYLVSARHTHALYGIDGTTGEILWTLGGINNDFIDLSDGRATDFAWQHDARWYDTRTITMYDNAAKEFLGPITASRGLIIDIDVPNRIASVRNMYFHPDGLRAHSQGNMQILPDSGNAFVGWGHCAAWSEFTAEGEVLCDTHLSPSNWFQLGLVFTYRTYKHHWVGKPLTIPAAAVVGNSVYVSWNGATEIVAWRLELWDGVDMKHMGFTHSDRVEKTSFETKINLPADIPNSYFRVVALDSQNTVLGVTDIISKHPKKTLAERLGIDVLDQMSTAVLITILMILCCAGLAIIWLWRLAQRTVRNRVARRFGFKRVLAEDANIPLITNPHED